MAIRGDSSTTAIVPFLLTKDNYEDWRIYMKNYLLAQDLWGIIESGNDVGLLSSSTDVGNLRKKNAAALHAIHTTSSPDIFAQIKKFESAKDAWNKLAQMHQQRSDEGKKVEIIEMTHFEGSNREEEDGMTEDSRCVELKKSICNGDWNAVKQFFVFDKHPLDTRIVSDRGYTALYVAIDAGQDKIAEELVKMMSETDLEVKSASNAGSRTALNAVAITGRTHLAKCIVQKNDKLLTIRNDSGRIPVTSACSMGHKEMTYYLYSVTPPEVFQPQVGNHGFDLMRWGMDNKMLGLKVKLPTTSSGEVRIPITDDQDHKEKNIEIQGVKQIYNLKLTNLYALEILRCMCNHVSTFKDQHLLDCGVVKAMFEATQQGMVQFVIELLKVTHPFIYHDRVGRNVFMVAIQYRRANIFNLLPGIHEAWKARILNRVDNYGNSMLHVAGEIAPDFRLARISSSALQMQRELQWFKEVERTVPEWCKEFKNIYGETPYEIFSKSHKGLVKEGEKWMKDTASSFIIVGTLIVTILFAAAFTLPGGNDDRTGFPIFLPRRAFMIFIMSDAVSFFAASASVLMFLGILTSRFAEEDFLKSLPRKLIIGLSTLFISIAAMTVSFSAALSIILQDRWWAIIPIIMMASIPVALFVCLQFPLLVEIFVSTYAPQIFNRKMKPWL
ncbi:hypothetical protein SLEP1_g43570 [Rubroshorea leprosula]|uniref:PGG domain-containing protein n=1 Tax=Rubroshorea leprosula TaxID=152421 RepID=A0AAV5LDD7_9ROSI|nr:hypothetical protein SLEP1_g43570 [Rubroshorea leprosula]